MIKYQGFINVCMKDYVFYTLWYIINGWKIENILEIC